MFERFRSAFQVTAQSHEERGSSYLPALADVDALMSEFAGSTFNEGLYRIHTVPGALRWTQRVADAFPSLKGGIWAFGADWLGRHFVLSWTFLVADELGVLMAEPGTGEVLEIPARFRQFHDEILVDQADAALAKPFFEQWRRTSKGRAIAEVECVGYKVPLFLGGKDDVDNLEIQDASVYTELSGHMWQQARSLRPGTKIAGVKIQGKRS